MNKGKLTMPNIVTPENNDANDEKEFETAISIAQKIIASATILKIAVDVQIASSKEGEM